MNNSTVIVIDNTTRRRVLFLVTPVEGASSIKVEIEEFQKILQYSLVGSRNFFDKTFQTSSFEEHGDSSKSLYG